MILPALFFYLFAGVCIASAFMVIAARNPVHSVLFLILAFVNASGLFVLLGAEFLAMILIVVYVGAVAVLFLFVVMMLDVDFASLRKGAQQYLPIGALIGAILLGELKYPRRLRRRYLRLAGPPTRPRSGRFSTRAMSTSSRPRVSFCSSP
jgi:NADH-quinone oxidoreductase subunit J